MWTDCIVTSALRICQHVNVSTVTLCKVGDVHKKQTSGDVTFVWLVRPNWEHRLMIVRDSLIICYQREGEEIGFLRIIKIYTVKSNSKPISWIPNIGRGIRIFWWRQYVSTQDHSFRFQEALGGRDICELPKLLAARWVPYHTHPWTAASGWQI